MKGKQDRVSRQGAPFYRARSSTCLLIIMLCWDWQEQICLEKGKGVFGFFYMNLTHYLK